MSLLFSFSLNSMVTFKDLRKNTHCQSPLNHRFAMYLFYSGGWFLFLGIASKGSPFPVVQKGKQLLESQASSRKRQGVEDFTKQSRQIISTLSKDWNTFIICYLLSCGLLREKVEWSANFVMCYLIAKVSLFGCNIYNA